MPSYWRGWRPCLYEAVFTISKELERVNNFARVEVNNPLDKNRTLDLLLNYAKIDDPQTEKVIETDFIFSGTLV